MGMSLGDFRITHSTSLHITTDWWWDWRDNGDGTYTLLRQNYGAYARTKVGDIFSAGSPQVGKVWSIADYQFIIKSLTSLISPPNIPGEFDQ